MSHRQFINDPRSLVAHALEGLEAAHPSLVRWNREPSFVQRVEAAAPPKVGVLSGGGSGHEPLHVGFVGRGMLDAAVPGAVFASPAVHQVEAATLAVDQGRGVLHIVKNYTGDLLNFGLAAELAADAGVAVETVVVDDDVATEQLDDEGPGRRGTAAVIAVEKICGAAAEQGADLPELAALGRRVVAGARSMAVALGAGTHPGEPSPSFDLGVNEMEIGIGIHGERGVARTAYEPAAGIATRLVGEVAGSLDLQAGESVLAIVNGLGSTYLLELHTMFREVRRLVGDLHVTIARSLVGSYVTSLDMAGCSVTLVRLDHELTNLWDAPVHTAALTW